MIGDFSTSCIGQDENTKEEEFSQENDQSVNNLAIRLQIIKSSS